MNQSNLKTATHWRPSVSRRAGLTLVEVLVALVVTLIVLGAMSRAFQFASSEMRKTRAIADLANDLRLVELRIRRDLELLTVEPKPFHGSQVTPKGYLEIIDGPRVDYNVIDEGSDPADGVPRAPVNYDNTILGDYDDVIAFTVKSDGKAFRGYTDGTVQESQLAEVIWFAICGDREDAGDTTRIGVFEPGEPSRLYRRQLLIRPDFNVARATLPNLPPAILNPLPTADPTNPHFFARADVDEYFRKYDISAHVIRDLANPSAEGYNIVANTLRDLSFRKNRFCHQRYFTPTNAAAPGPIDNPTLNVLLRSPQPLPLLGNVADPGQLVLFSLESRLADLQYDIMMSDVIAFDVQVFDPTAPVLVENTSGNFLEPVDRGFIEHYPRGEAPVGATPVDPLNGYAYRLKGGAYTDLGKSEFTATVVRNTTTLLTPPSEVVPITGNLGAITAYNPRVRDNNGNIIGITETGVYDTGTSEYERDGLDNDGDSLIDEGSDGLDSDGNGIVDDIGAGSEQEVVPSYNVPIQGLRISIRSIEPSTGQIRQSSLTQDFDIE